MLPSTFEDYLEAILMITESDGRAATLDEIAAALDTEKEVTGTTVSSLVEEGYLERAENGAVRLTGKGSSLATRVTRKHRVLQCFLTEMLGVDEDAASREACTLEHGISDETIERLSSYMDGAQCPPAPACQMLPGMGKTLPGRGCLHAPRLQGGRYRPGGDDARAPAAPEASRSRHLPRRDRADPAQTPERIRRCQGERL